MRRELHPSALKQLIERGSMPVTESGCWLWLHYIGPTGYGRLRVGNRMGLAHRVSWEVHNGCSAPPEMNVMHSCDIRCCVNPDHLSLGTFLENMEDRQRKNRTPRGETLRQSHLTESDVVSIRLSTESTHALARSFGVTRGTIFEIRNHLTWTHVQAQHSERGK